MVTTLTIYPGLWPAQTMEPDINILVPAAVADVRARIALKKFS